MSSLDRIKSDLAAEDPAVANVAIGDVAAPQSRRSFRPRIPASCSFHTWVKADSAAAVAEFAPAPLPSRGSQRISDPKPVRSRWSTMWG